MATDKLYVGIDVGGTKILATVADASGKVLSRAKVKTQAAEGVDPVVARMAEATGKALSDAKVKASDVGGLGVGFAGPVDFDNGVVITAGNMPFNNVPLRKLLIKAIGIEPVVIDNDVNAGTYGEWQAGAGQKLDSLIGVFVGTGIGGGIVLNGKLYRGHYHTAGEIGHTIINDGGHITGRRLEDLASRGALGVHLSRRIATNHPSSLSDDLSDKKLFTGIRSKHIKRGVEDKDPMTLAMIAESARYTGVAAANAVTLLSLPAVILGGGLVEALGSMYVKQVEQALRKDIWPEDLDVKVLEAKLGDDAVSLGAALLARDHTG